ncbi:hypothetical protein LV779_36625 [Streptomyces thinghirensis]|nr:hypothetical protein [Streptomyces thinghirensis]
MAIVMLLSAAVDAEQLPQARHRDLHPAGAHPELAAPGELLRRLDRLRQLPSRSTSPTR